LKQNLDTWTQTQAGSQSMENEDQLPLSRALFLHLAPGTGLIFFNLLITPLLINKGFPAELGFLLGLVFISIPLELGYLLYLGKKRNGVFSLRGIVLYTQRMPLWQYVALFLPFFIYGLGLQAIYSPIASRLSNQVFGWMPAYLLPEPSKFTPFTAITLITVLLTITLDGILSPIVEELYFRGFLLPRLSRWGWFAPVVNAFLFTFQHFWQPYNYPFIFLLVLPEVMIVRWKHNIRFSILCHCAGNTLGAVLMLIALVSTH
jgi:uncharacterized protein